MPEHKHTWQSSAPACCRLHRQLSRALRAQQLTSRPAEGSALRTSLICWDQVTRAASRKRTWSLSLTPAPSCASAGRGSTVSPLEWPTVTCTAGTARSFNLTCLHSLRLQGQGVMACSAPTSKSGVVGSRREGRIQGIAACLADVCVCVCVCARARCGGPDCSAGDHACCGVRMALWHAPDAWIVPLIANLSQSGRAAQGEVCW